MAVADDQPDAVHPALVEAREHPAPVHLVLAQVAVDREDGAVPVREDARDDERGRRDDHPVDAHLVVGRVGEQDLHLAYRAVAPVLELLVQLAHGPRDLVGRDVHVAQLGEHVLDLPRRDALYVHLRDGHPERAVAPGAALEAPGVERAVGVAHLRDAQPQLPGGRVERLGLVAVGVSPAFCRALVPARS